MVPGRPVVTCHPEHVQSLFKAKPLKQGMRLLDAVTYPIIKARRQLDDLHERTDILSMINVRGPRTATRSPTRSSATSG